MCKLTIHNSNETKMYNILTENIDIDDINVSIKDLNKLIRKSLGFKKIKRVICDNTTRCVNVCDINGLATSFVANNTFLYEISKEYILKIYNEDRKNEIFNLVSKYKNVQIDCNYNDIQTSYRCSELQDILKIDLQINELYDFEFVKQLISELYDEKPDFEYETVHDEYGKIITGKYDENYFKLDSDSKKICFKNCPKEIGIDIKNYVFKKREK